MLRMLRMGVKMKFCAFLRAAVAVLGSVSLAVACGPLPAAVPPPASSAPSSSAPPLVEVRPDRTGSEGVPSEEPKPLPWRGTTFTWSQSATTTMLNIGRDTLGHEHEAYGWL